MKKSLTVEDFKIDKIIIYVKQSIDEILENGINEKGCSVDELEKNRTRKKLLEKNLRNCGVGDIGAKEYIKGYIQDILTRNYSIDETNIDNTIYFKDVSKLSVQDKFDILLQVFKVNYGYDALAKIVHQYNLDKLRDSDDGKKFFISSSDIEKIYENENVDLSYETKLDVLVQRIYSSYKGLGVIDELRDMSINGLSLGLSGIPESFLASIDVNVSTISKEIDNLPKSFDSIWLNFEGKEMHLEFLSFGSYEELERVCKLSYKFNNPPQLSEAKPYIFNTTADNCRIAVFRPPFCETWIALLRKFNVDGELSNLVKGKNSENVIRLNDFLIKGEQTIAITGQQGAGKTTFTKALLQRISPIYTIRVSESFFEMHLRNVMPRRNIMTIQEVESVSRNEALDSLKKTNGAVTVIGEAAEDEDVKHIAKVAQVASKFTLFTHHAKNFPDLIKSLRNSLLNVKLFSNESLAEEQVVSMLDFNIHLRLTPEGDRYIERITECVPVDNIQYNRKWENKATLEGKLNEFMKTVVQFFEASTNIRKYKAINILEYNIDSEEYEIKNNISEARIKEMEKNMLKEDREAFRNFCEKVLGRNE